MNSWIKLLRLNICLLTVLGVIAGSVISGSFYNPFKISFALLAAFLIAGAGNVINDYFDYESDKINNSSRPLVSGKISKNKALYFWAFLNLLGASAAFFVSPPYLTIAIVNIAVAFIYSWKLQYLPVVGNLADTYLAAIPFLAGGLIIMSFLEVFSSVPLMTIFIIVFIGNWSREVYKDIEDLKGDKETGSNTLPVLLGKKRSLWFARVLLFVSALLLIYPYYKGLFAVPYLISIILPEVLIVYSLFKNEKKAQRALKIVMFLVMFAFLVGTVLGMNF